jgi:orotate phosphoribosyltransferase
MEETIPIVKAQGDVTIVGLMVSLNRQEFGLSGDRSKTALDEVAETYGFKTGAIVSMDEVVEHLWNIECQGRVVIDDEMKTRIDAYYKEYGVQ